jgi:hypothetical protein
MIRFVAITLVVLQSFVFAGPVCAAHFSSGEAMDCCEMGRSDAAESGWQNPDAAACCAKCDMGKTHFSSLSIKPALRIHAPALHVPPAVFGYVEIVQPPVNGGKLQERWTHQKFSSTDPPRIYILNQSFLI